MKVNEAIAVMNDTNATDAQLVEAETAFRAAGLKGLLDKVQTVIGQRNRKAMFVADADYGEHQVSRFSEAILHNAAMHSIANNDVLGLRLVAGALLLAKCERIVDESFYNPDANPECQ